MTSLFYKNSYQKQQNKQFLENRQNEPDRIYVLDFSGGWHPGPPRRAMTHDLGNLKSTVFRRAQNFKWRHCHILVINIVIS